MEPKDWITIAISCVGLVIACIAALYAYRAPLEAVDRAEEARKKAQNIEQKLQILNVLLAERGHWGSPAMLTALNCTRTVFLGDSNVNDAWFELYQKSTPNQDRLPAYLSLIKAMADNLQLALRAEDLNFFFVNNTDILEQEVRSLTVEATHRNLTANTSGPSTPPPPVPELNQP